MEAPPAMPVADDQELNSPQRERPQSAIRACWAILALAIFVAAGGQVQAQSVTDVEIDFPAVINLTCTSPLRFRVNDTTLRDIYAGGTDQSIATANGIVIANANGTGLEATLTGLNTTLPSDPSQVIGLANRACRIRSTTKGNGLMVSVALTNGLLYGPASTTAWVNAVDARRNLTGGAYATTFSIPEAGIRRNERLDLRLEFDMSNAGLAGTYSSPPGGTFTVTVTAP